MFAKTKSQNPKRHDDISKTPSETQIPLPWPRQRQHQAMMISIRRMSSPRQPNLPTYNPTKSIPQPTSHPFKSQNGNYTTRHSTYKINSKSSIQTPCPFLP